MDTNDLLAPIDIFPDPSGRVKSKETPVPGFVDAARSVITVSGQVVNQSDGAGLKTFRALAAASQHKLPDMFEAEPDQKMSNVEPLPCVTNPVNPGVNTDNAGRSIQRGIQ